MDNSHDSNEPVATVESVATVVSESGNQEVTMSWWHEPALPVGTKLYTTPPQRKPLTDKEMSIVSLREKTSDHDVDCLCADCTLLDEMEDAQKCYCGNIYRLGVVHREDSFCDEHPRKPLKIEELPAMRDGDHAFLAGVRFAEQAHGIKD